MLSPPLFLKPNIKLEPLVDQWYAWSHLISPAPAARWMAQSHLAIMESYISAPSTHASAVRNPKMRGGPFIDYEVCRVAEIIALRDRIKKERRSMFALSDAISKMDVMLRQEAKGQSLSEVYKRVPDVLRGYVELVYDLNNAPTYRFVEPLLYKSQHYDRSAQTVSLSATLHDERPFVLSTPRLDSDTSVTLPLSFDSLAIDLLCCMKHTPASWEEISELLRPSPDKKSLLRSFFSTSQPRPYRGYDGEGVRWRYFGHACILVETKQCRLLFDPVISYSYDSSLPRYTYEDLPEEIDYVLITHNHQDHILLETLLQLRHRVKTIIVPRCGWGSLQDPSIKLMLENIGFTNVKELSEMESLPIHCGSIRGVPFFGEHADLDVKAKLGYSVLLEGHSLMFLADSCNLEPSLYTHVQQEIGNVDALFIGMECEGAPLSWLYGPLLTRPLDRTQDNSRRLNGSNYTQALDIVTRFGCKEVYVYAMGQEPWLNYIMSVQYTDESRPIIESNRLIAQCHSLGKVAERLFGEKEILLR
jgi:L-ascorbate metabolism protein UlaG (beta-lactamase superfamily)